MTVPVFPYSTPQIRRAPFLTPDTVPSVEWADVLAKNNKLITDAKKWCKALKLNPKYSLAKKNLESLPKLDDGFHLYQSPTTDDD